MGIGPRALTWKICCPSANPSRATGLLHAENPWSLCRHSKVLPARLEEKTNSALPDVNTAEDVGNAAVFLCSPLGAGITGETLHVDMGFHAMGMPAEDRLGGE